MKLTPA